MIQLNSGVIICISISIIFIKKGIKWTHSIGADAAEN